MSAPAPLALRIYYEDTDFSGAVYHARYLHFFERGRTEALRELGIDQRALFEAEGGPFAFVVRRMTTDYRRPARMDDLVMVETVVEAIGGASIEMHQRITRAGAAEAEAEAKAEVLAEAAVTIAFLAAGRPARLPNAMRDKLVALQQN